MDLNKAQRLLLKIQALLDSDNGNTLSRLEKDLMKSYIQQLYEAVTTDEVASVSPPPSPEPKIVYEPPVIVPPPPSPKPQPELMPPPSPEPTLVYEPPVTEIPPPPSPEPPPELKPPPSPEPPPSLKPPPEIPSAVSGAEEDAAMVKLFDTPRVDERSGRFSHMPIASIESAMGLNERIFTLNDLFGGDKGLFDATCAQLNSLPSYEEARRVLMAGPARQFHWTDPERIRMAEEFIRIVVRRYPRG